MTNQDGGGLYRIGQIAARCSVNTKTVRYYESIGLMPPPARIANGYRTYTETDVARLEFIRRAQSLGLSLAAIQDILAMQDAGNHPCAEVHQLATLRISEIDQQIAELQRMREELTDLATRAADVKDDVRPTSDFCPAIARA